MYRYQASGEDYAIMYGYGGPMYGIGTAHGYGVAWSDEVDVASALLA
jgi:hypothetical protein